MGILQDWEFPRRAFDQLTQIPHRLKITPQMRLFSQRERFLQPSCSLCSIVTVFTPALIRVKLERD